MAGYLRLSQHYHILCLTHKVENQNRSKRYNIPLLKYDSLQTFNINGIYFPLSNGEKRPSINHEIKIALFANYEFIYIKYHIKLVYSKENACLFFIIKNKFDFYLFDNIHSFHQNNKGE